MTKKLNVGVNHINQRLDNYLIRELKNVPKSLIYRLIRKKAIRVNNKATKPDYKVLLNDEITLPVLNDVRSGADSLDQRKKQVTDKLAKTLESRIIYDSKDFLVLNKPSGMAVHAGSKVNFGVIDILRNIYGKSQYVELVHRLDRDTSGCLIIAKNRLALNDLNLKLKEKEINKTYMALVKGGCSNSLRTISHPLRRSVLKGGERMVVVDHELGKEALTKVSVSAVKSNTSLLELSPVTGRTHQLRVHIAYEGYPIIGDNKYGDKEINKELKAKVNLGRIFLHAYKLDFHWGRNRMNLIADLDSDLEKTLIYLGYI